MIQQLRYITTSLLPCCGLLLPTIAFPYITQVRVINETAVNIYFHVGGFPASKKVSPGKWHIFKYPFIGKKPNSTGEDITTGLLVVSAGGNWITTQHGYT